MEGTVHLFDAESGRLAVDTSTGYSILEVEGGAFVEGDHVSWAVVPPIGTCRLKNHSTGASHRAYPLHHGVPKTLLRANF